MIYTITFNPSLDYIVSVENFVAGKVNRTTDECILPGGKGINVSQVLTNLGVENTALGFVAGFTGKELIRLLDEKEICSDFIYAEDGFTRINVKLHANLEETEINGQGPHVSESELEELMNKINQFTEDDILILSGSVPRGVSKNIYADIAKLCIEKNIRIVVDASGDLLWNVLEYKPFLIKPNHHELGELFGKELDNRDEIIFYAKELQNKGAKNVLVSRGGRGAILIAEDGDVYEEDAPHGEVVNTVGAGDSMVAGFLTGYVNTKNYKEALQMGICTGSASAFSEGLATRDSVEVLRKL